MRTVVPTTRLHPTTGRLLNKYAPGHERVFLTGMDGYWQLVTELWGNGESFMLVEHDIGIHANVLPDFAACPSWWCGFHGYRPMD